MSLVIFTKQPREILDIDFDFSEWLGARPDAVPGSPIAEVDSPGLTINSAAIDSGIVRVIVSGGTNGVKYKLTVQLPTTVLVLRKESDCYVKIKEE